ncbi:hypothetical protein BGZ83_004883 [Gryganskiella cystojenkinii]|nr:hypothetical protein BGZ83_004883 [Gryganskiella cystojenkinii]
MTIARVPGPVPPPVSIMALPRTAIFTTASATMPIIVLVIASVIVSVVASVTACSILAIFLSIPVPVPVLVHVPIVPAFAIATISVTAPGRIAVITPALSTASTLTAVISAALVVPSTPTIAYVSYVPVIPVSSVTVPIPVSIFPPNILSKTWKIAPACPIPFWHLERLWRPRLAWFDVFFRDRFWFFWFGA